MTEKGSNTTLVKKRRDALKVGLENLKDTWNDVDSIYDNEVMLKSKDGVRNKH